MQLAIWLGQRRCILSSSYSSVMELGAWTVDMFLTKFQYMDNYLWWLNDEDMFYHLCASLEGAVGQFLWDIGPCTMTADIICLLQTRFGTLLQAERFKAELCVRRDSLGEVLGSPSSSCVRTFVDWLP